MLLAILCCAVSASAQPRVPKSVRDGWGMKKDIVRSERAIRRNMIQRLVGDWSVMVAKGKGRLERLVFNNMDTMATEKKVLRLRVKSDTLYMSEEREKHKWLKVKSIPLDSAMIGRKGFVRVEWYPTPSEGFWLQFTSINDRSWDCFLGEFERDEHGIATGRYEGGYTYMTAWRRHD